MGVISWIKTNLILVLAAALGVTLLFGSVGTLYYKWRFEKADLRAQVAEANLATAKTVNDSLAGSVERQNKAIDTALQACTMSKEAAQAALDAAKAAGAPARKLAQTLKDFTPANNTPGQPCAAEHSIVDKFFEGKGALK